MVFTPLCRGNQMGGLYHGSNVQAWYHDSLITKYRNIDTFKISRYIAKTVVSLSPSSYVLRFTVEFSQTSQLKPP